MHKAKPNMTRKELVFFDPKNPRSIISMVPEMFAKRMQALWLSDDAYLLGMPDHKLRGELIRRGKCPTATDSRIRLQFWLEYDRVQAEPRPEAMEMAYVIGFAMAKEAFYIHYIQDNCALAWLLCPPAQYVHALEEVLRESMERIRLALQVDVTKANGEPNGRALAFILKTDRELFQRWAALTKTKVAIELPKEEEPEGPDGLFTEPSEHNQTDAERAERRKRIEQLQKEAEKNGAKA